MHLLGATIKSENRGAEPVQPRLPSQKRGGRGRGGGVGTRGLRLPGIMRRVGRARASSCSGSEPLDIWHRKSRYLLSSPRPRGERGKAGRHPPQVPPPCAPRHRAHRRSPGRVERAEPPVVPRPMGAEGFGSRPGFIYPPLSRATAPGGQASCGRAPVRKTSPTPGRREMRRGWAGYHMFSIK